MVRPITWLNAKRVLNRLTISGPRLIVITSEGYIGVGLETRARVAQRLAVKNLRDGYATGFEPCEQNVQKFMLFLDLVCQGTSRARSVITAASRIMADQSHRFV